MNKIVRSLLLPLALATAIGTVALDQAAGQDRKDKKTATATASTVVFELYKDRQDEYRFRLKDGDVLLAISGKGYKTKADCLKVIDAIKNASARAKVEEAAPNK
jgi:uncharacterized protein YegP (UPF0339 family)